MFIRIDASSATPIYAQIAAAVRHQVADGALSAGTKLLPARDLAEALGINVHTVLRGYQQLRDEGVIELRRGRGAVVTEQATSAGARAALAVYVEQAKRSGMSAAQAAALVEEAMRS